MVLGHSSNVASMAGSVLLTAENLYSEYAPNRAELQSIAFRLYTGVDPDHVETAKDPARALPAHGYDEFAPHPEHHKRDTVLFEQEDMTAWGVFTLVFFGLVIFDNFILHRKAEKLSLLQAVLYTTFWIAVAGMFNCYVWYTRGAEDAFSWGTGYLLEWMLSVDNLFVFHRIFIIFKTPDEQKHKPLFYGIMGAIVFRMIFFLIEEILMHHVSWMHLVFGAFLIYTGIKAVSMDDDEESPDQGYLFQLLLSHIKYVDRYDETGRFFVPVEIAAGKEDETPRIMSVSESKSLLEAQDTDGAEVKTPIEWRATRLVLVVVCLEVTDLVFAVDSVSAIVAQIPDLFLAYTACVFAMLGLRAMFFAIDELVKMFTLLGYGVAFILIFIGMKLILRSWIHIPPEIVCFILIGTLIMSVLASVIQDKYFGEDKDEPEDTECPSARVT